MTDRNGHWPPPPAAGDFAGRLPPQNLEAERGLIGAMLLDGRCIDDVLTVLDESHFYRDTHRRIFGAIRDVHAGGGAVDALLVADRLEARGELESCGGIDALGAIVEATPHAAHAAHYARIVRDKATTRQLVEAAAEILRDGYSDLHTADDLLQRAERRLFALSGAAVAGPGPRPASEVTAEAMRRIEARRKGGLAGIPTGWRDLDDLIGGFHPGNLILVAARPSMGKTACALNICEHAAGVLGLPALLFSLEMGAAEVGERLLSAKSRIGSYHLRNAGLISEADWEHLQAVQAGYAAVPLLVDDSGDMTVPRLATAARRAARQGGLSLLVVDYVQILGVDSDSSRGASRQEQVAAMSRQLKALAKELGCPVVALSQLNRLVEYREDKRPRLSDLRETGALEQDADLVILLHRPEYYDPKDRPGLAEVIVAKHRNGATRTIQLTWLGPTTRFVNYAEPEIVPDAGPEF